MTVLTNNERHLTRGDDYLEPDSAQRLCFENEQDLKECIKSGGMTGSTYSINGLTSPSGGSFVSLLTPMPSTTGSGETTTYYEALGYDSLVPNVNFAKLLNIQGEMEVGDDIVKIMPEGTFLVPKKYNKEFRTFLSNKDPKIHTQEPIAPNTYLIDKKYKLITTFKIDPIAYSTVSEGNYSELPEDYFGPDSSDTPLTTRGGTKEPDFNDFAIFSPDRTTKLGKIIQNLIGTTKAHTIYYNKKRRVKGSFYSYDYGVYAEIGVKGWTDKKNMLNWSKVKSDELRVGWRNVIIDLPMDKNIKERLQGNVAAFVKNPAYTDVNGTKVLTTAVILPEMSQSFWDKIIARGVKAALEEIKRLYDTSKVKDLDKTEALVITTPSKIRYVATDDDVVKYNEKSYCHVFQNLYMDITFGWSNTDGIFINNVNQNNATDFATYLKLIIDLFTREKMTLVNGEVYICARLNDEWRGMKIRKTSN